MQKHLKQENIIKKKNKRKVKISPNPNEIVIYEKKRIKNKT